MPVDLAGVKCTLGVALVGAHARRAEMGHNGRALVESRFAWPRVAEEMEKAYLSTMNAER